MFSTAVFWAGESEIERYVEHGRFLQVTHASASTSPRLSAVTAR
jgi:hypothetical protein